MKSFLLILLLIPVTLFSQEDKKYLAGAVPVVDSKVTISQTFSVPGTSSPEIFAAALRWAQSRFVTNKDEQGRILYSSQEKGEIAAMGNEYLVFTSKAFVLDRANINYQFRVFCTPDKCEAQMIAIRYTYNTGGKMENFRAEETITDEMALNKKKDKLTHHYGKFRTHTIDLADELFAGLKTAVLQGAKNTGTPAAIAAKPGNAAQSPPAEATNTVPDTKNSWQGYKQIPADKIPGNIYKMLSENWMLITAGNDKEFNMMTASWGGLGHLFGKPVTFCFINPSRHTYPLMEKSDTYTLSFYTEAYRDALQYCGSHSGKDTDKVKGSGLTPITTPQGSKAFSEAWMIIECKKIVSQPLQTESLSDQKLRDEWTGKTINKMYIGEILNVWVK